MIKDYVHGGDIYRHPGVMDFSANVNPLGTPRSVIQAAVESMSQIRHYPDAKQEALLTALAEAEQVPVEWLILGNGAAELIFTLVHTIRPQKALLAIPTFAEYAQALESVGCEIVTERLKKEEGFTLQGSFLQRIEKEKPDMVFLCNPNNPTGVTIPGGLLQEIVEQCEKQNCLLMLDECFLDFVTEKDTYSLNGVLEKNKNVFLLKAFTKRYAMPGLRLGYGVSANIRLLEQMQQHLQPWNISIPAQAAGVAALAEDVYVEQAKELIETERDYLKKELERCGFVVYDGKANYLLFQGEEGLRETLLKQNIMIRDCGNYPGLTKGYYRIAVKTREENQKLIKALEKREGEKRWQKQ